MESSATDDDLAIHIRLRRDRNLFLVAVDGSQIVGTLIAGWDGWRGSMARLAVHPSYRRRGIAQRLLDVAEARLRKLGVKRIGALVRAGNKPAEQFWRTAGYVPEPKIRRFVKNVRK